MADDVLKKERGYQKWLTRVTEEEFETLDLMRRLGNTGFACQGIRDASLWDQSVWIELLIKGFIEIKREIAGRPYVVITMAGLAKLATYKGGQESG